MGELIWETVNVRQSTRRSGEAFASIGQGRISLNADACDLIDDIYNYDWVNIMQAKEGNRVVKIGIRFTNTKDNYSLRAVRRKYKNENAEGININSKQLVKKYFGETKETSTSRYLVEKVDESTLAINISREL
ncbi:hypothetical protein D9O40_06135 [Clostridium autoethanogenum]|uniref:Uncharacterized protein n=1 Tax=Clostridium autoethanogenum TaxID=84023 RepID=A0A3M0T5N0_9CLOT|nr:hypothetical protein [Clostridium autoethanogenum]RMD02358.1 hypothetical protein D9O40_06135 [Clostridium autoethanogenum]